MDMTWLGYACWNYVEIPFWNHWKSFLKTLLFDKENMNDSENTHILKATIEYILSTERFNVPLFE